MGLSTHIGDRHIYHISIHRDLDTHCKHSEYGMDDHEAYHLLAHLGLVWPAFDSGLFFPGKPGMAGDLVFPERALDARCMSAI